MSRRLLLAIVPRAVRPGLHDAWGWAQALAGAGRILRAVAKGSPEPLVYYGRQVPRLDERAHGGLVKVQHMQAEFPNSPERFNVLYLVSSQPPPGAGALARIARLRGARLVWNQNGVAYPAWYGPGWERVNRPMAAGLRQADHVIYQSEFCRLSADRFLGAARRTCEVLHNPVDTSLFTPGPPHRDDAIVIVLGGSQYQWYKVATALRTLASVRRRGIAARLLVTGALTWRADPAIARDEADRLAAELGVGDVIEYTGPYAQASAPAILRRGHLLLHAKVNDPCPGIVLEAMACGLPIVYADSGGTPELVGTDAGIGVPSEATWERETPPDAEALASAVVAVVADRDLYAVAARQRVVERFDLRRWLARHDEIFRDLLA